MLFDARFFQDYSIFITMNERTAFEAGNDNQARVESTDIESDGGGERIPNGDNEGVIKDFLQQTLAELWKKQRSEKAEGQRSESSRAFGLTHFNLEEGGLQARESVHQSEALLHERVDTLEENARVLIEGLTSVKEKRAPNNDFLVLLDGLEGQLAHEVSRAYEHCATFDSPRSQELLELARRRLSAVSDYKRECLELLSKRIESKGREN